MATEAGDGAPRAGGQPCRPRRAGGDAQSGPLASPEGRGGRPEPRAGCTGGLRRGGPPEADEHGEDGTGARPRGAGGWRCPLRAPRRARVSGSPPNGRPPTRRPLPHGPDATCVPIRCRCRSLCRVVVHGRDVSGDQPARPGDGVSGRASGRCLLSALPGLTAREAEHVGYGDLWTTAIWLRTEFAVLRTMWPERHAPP